jgi:hypothetical protein
MKKTVASMIIITCLIAVLPLFAKPKYKNIKKLTPIEIADVNDFMTVDLVSDANFVEYIEKSKDFKGTNVRCGPQMRNLEVWQRKIERGEKTKKNRDGTISPATMEDVWKITRLDRPWNSDPNMLDDILLKLRCPLDGHLYADDLGVDPNE